MGRDERKPDFIACEQQRRRLAGASAQSDHRLFYSLSEKKSKYNYVRLVLQLFGGLQHDKVSGYAPEMCRYHIRRGGCTYHRYSLHPDEEKPDHRQRHTHEYLHFQIKPLINL